MISHVTRAVSVSKIITYVNLVNVRIRMVRISLIVFVVQQTAQMPPCSMEILEKIRTMGYFVLKMRINATLYPVPIKTVSLLTPLGGSHVRVEQSTVKMISCSATQLEAIIVVKVYRVQTGTV